MKKNNYLYFIIFITIIFLSFLVFFNITQNPKKIIFDDKNFFDEVILMNGNKYVKIGKTYLESDGNYILDHNYFFCGDIEKTISFYEFKKKTILLDNGQDIVGGFQDIYSNFYEVNNKNKTEFNLEIYRVKKKKTRYSNIYDDCENENIIFIKNFKVIIQTSK